MWVEKPSLVVALLGEEQEFQRLQAHDARRAAADLGFRLHTAFAEGNAILQIQQLYKFIHSRAEDRPKAIVVETVAGEGLERVARAAAAAGIGWVLINRNVSYLDDLRRDYPTLPIFAIGTDQEEVGRIQARQIRALLPALSGVVLYIQGPADTSAAQERLRGTQDGLRDTGITLGMLDGLWTEASGEVAMRRWLQLRSSAERPVLVVAQNDAMAIGARRALEACRGCAELARLPLMGVDGLVDGGQRLVDSRQLAATVVCQSNTGPAVELVAQALKTQQQGPARVLLTPQSYPPEKELAMPAPFGARSLRAERAAFPLSQSTAG